MSGKRKIINGIIFEEVENSVFRYDSETKEKIPIAKAPFASWKGKKVPHLLWMQIIGFLSWSYEKYKEEATIRVYYNEETGEWKAHAFPQTPSGLAVTDSIDAEQYKEYIGGDFDLAMTVHHHCTLTAFQSGGDKHDETTKTGIHVTVGKMDKEVYDFHTRISIKGAMYEADLEDVVDVPGINDGKPYKYWFPKDLREAYTKMMLCQAVDNFPEIWKANVKDPATARSSSNTVTVLRHYGLQEDENVFFDGYPTGAATDDQSSIFGANAVEMMIGNIDQPTESYLKQMLGECQFVPMASGEIWVSTGKSNRLGGRMNAEQIFDKAYEQAATIVVERLEAMQQATGTRLTQDEYDAQQHTSIAPYAEILEEIQEAVLNTVTELGVTVTTRSLCDLLNSITRKG